jgi:hypothetical protein
MIEAVNQRKPFIEPLLRFVTRGSDRMMQIAQAKRRGSLRLRQRNGNHQKRRE